MNPSLPLGTLGWWLLYTGYLACGFWEAARWYPRIVAHKQLHVFGRRHMAWLIVNLLWPLFTPVRWHREWRAFRRRA